MSGHRAGGLFFFPLNGYHLAGMAIMTNGDAYQREQDLVFQEIGERAKLKSQAEADERLEFLATIGQDRDMAAIFKALPVEERVRRLRRLVQLAFPNDADD
jgi:hypothetical protein